jgi:hypothetical protein
MLGARFRAACKRFGLAGNQYQLKLRCDQFKPPGQPQLALEL